MFGGTTSQNQSVPIGKTSDESVTGSTTLQNDDQLVFNADKNSLYVVEYFLRATFDTLGQIKVAVNAPSSDFILVNAQMVSDGVVPAYNSASALATGVSLVCSTATAGMITVRASILTGSTGGEVALQWAQAVSNGNPTTVKAGSYLRYQKIV